jgi:competence protein ComEA|tara:strand:+ start:712 stop:1008 length:297 start_codon:yes stop_codon:yes gene_type:complete
MNAKKLFLSCITGLLLSYGNQLMADDVPGDFATTTVNINEADAKTLSKMLDGVGMRKAQDIIAYREKNGRFFLAEELSAVKGIGRTTVMKNEGKIVVN